MSGGMPSTLDSSALLALVRNEPGAGVVLTALTRAGNVCYAHEVNLCEVFYVRARELGEAQAERDLELLLAASGVIPFASPDSRRQLLSACQKIGRGGLTAAGAVSLGGED
jgi:uncharacterized protein with PIN domain